MFCVNLELKRDSSQIDANALGRDHVFSKQPFRGCFEKHIVACPPPGPFTLEISSPVLLCLSITWTVLTTILRVRGNLLFGSGRFSSGVGFAPCVCSSLSVDLLLWLIAKVFSGVERTSVEHVFVSQELRQYWRILRASRQTRFWNPRRPTSMTPVTICAKKRAASARMLET